MYSVLCGVWSKGWQPSAPSRCVVLYSVGSVDSVVCKHRLGHGQQVGEGVGRGGAVRIGKGWGAFLGNEGEIGVMSAQRLGLELGLEAFTH